MKIALASARFVNGDIDRNIKTIQHYMKEAKEKGADLICFGEAFLQGFDALNYDLVHDHQIAQSVDGTVFKALCHFSKKIGIDLMLGFIEKDLDTLYSSYALIMEGIVSHVYRRVTKGWKEADRYDAHYQEGNEIRVFSYRDKTCVIALCGDLWEDPNAYALKEDLLFWPIYVNFHVDEWNQEQRTQYAKQASLVCKDALLINSLSDDPDAYGGCYYYHEGEICKSLEMKEEGLLIVEI